MFFYDNERVALYIDGQSLYSTQRALGFEIDYKKLLDFFRSRGYLVRAYYYAILPDEEEHVSIRRLVDWLDYNGYCVRIRYRKNGGDPVQRKRTHQAVSVDIAVDALTMADHIDHAVFLSADGDLSVAVRALVERGRRVTVIGAIDQAASLSFSDELRRSADQFVDLKQILPSIARLEKSSVRAPDQFAQSA